MSVFDLSGRIAIVTGGNGGIGLGMAEGLAAAGAIVVLAGRNAEKGEAAVQRIARGGGKAEFAEADVTSETSCRALIDAAAARTDASIFSSITPALTSASRPSG